MRPDSSGIRHNTLRGLEMEELDSVDVCCELCGQPYTRLDEVGEFICDCWKCPGCVSNLNVFHTCGEK